MKKGEIIVDVSKCVGCKTCELQCAVAHSKSKDLYQAVLECPTPQGRVKVEAEAELVMPLQCRHCEDAPCIKICPSKALDRKAQDQPVLIDQERCIGCKWCMMVCPFGVIATDKAGKAVIKCDLCIARLKENKIPACVEGCPTKALKFEPLKDVGKSKRKKYLVGIAGK